MTCFLKVTIRTCYRPGPRPLRSPLLSLAWPPSESSMYQPGAALGLREAPHPSMTQSKCAARYGFWPWLEKKPFEPHRRTKCKPGGQCGTVMRKALPPQPLSLPVQKTRLQPLPPPSPGVASGPPAPPTSRPAQATPGQQSVAAPIAGQLAALARGIRGHLLFGEVKGSS